MTAMLALLAAAGVGFILGHSISVVMAAREERLVARQRVGRLGDRAWPL